MGNKSNWKGWEKEVADAIGGKRRNFSQFASARSRGRGSKVTDVFWPKDIRKENPFLKRVQVECKKRRALNIFTEFAIARLKYAKDEDSLIVLACKRPAPRSKKAWKKRKKILIKQYVRLTGDSESEAKKKIKRDMFIGGIVAVDLEFFKELFSAWRRREHGKLVREGK